MTNEFVLGIVRGHPPVVRIASPGAAYKWQPIFDQLPNMNIISRPADKPNDGWVGFNLPDKKLAAGAASSVASHCDRIIKCREKGWRIATSIQTTPDGVILWFRKVAI